MEGEETERDNGENWERTWGNMARMYGRSGDGRLEGDERDRQGEIITHLKRRMATRERPPVTTQSNMIKKHANLRKGTKQERGKTKQQRWGRVRTTSRSVNGQTRTNHRKELTWFLANVTRAECAFPFRRILNTAALPSPPEIMRLTA